MVSASRVIETDVLVIGGGGAAARAALEARQRGASVTMVMKGAFGSCGSTAYKIAEIAGYNAADGQVDPLDSPAEHLKDILIASAGTCDERLASILAHEAPSTLPELESWDVPLERDGDHYLEVIGCFASRPRMHIIPGHAEPVLAALASRLRELDVRIVENSLVTRLLVQEGSCVGAVALDRAGELTVFKAKATAMGTGGAGQLFLNNLNPPDVTGDGYALGFNAGAELINMEFMQSGPAIIHPVRNIFNGWAWMLHPRVYNSLGDEFLQNYVPREMTPERCMDLRSDHYPFSCYDNSHWIDVAIQKEILAGRGTPEGGVFVDLTRVSLDDLPATSRGQEVRKMWAMTKRWLLEKRHLDVDKVPVQVACFGHAINGGMWIDERAETTVKGLFAAGEAAGGPHGADRLGGNMVVTLMVFGKRMGRFAAERALAGSSPWRADDQVAGEESRLNQLSQRRGDLSPQQLKRKIQECMWRGILVVRNEEKLQRCLGELAEIRAEAETRMAISDSRGLWASLEVENMVATGEIMARSALLRDESRGSHYREDRPQRDERWAQSIATRLRDGQLEQRTVQLPRLD